MPRAQAGKSAFEARASIGTRGVLKSGSRMTCLFGWGSGDGGLGLPLTKALADANGASFAIKSARNAGTLVEVEFPARVAAS